MGREGGKSYQCGCVIIVKQFFHVALKTIEKHFENSFFQRMLYVSPKYSEFHSDKIYIIIKRGS